MFDAKLVTMIRPRTRENTSSRWRPTPLSEGEKPGRSALVELRACHRDGEASAVDGRSLPQLAQDPGQCPDMVLVAMGDDDPVDVPGPLTQVAEIRQHEIDPEHVGRREPQPRVNDHDPLL